MSILKRGFYAVSFVERCVVVSVPRVMCSVDITIKSHEVEQFGVSFRPCSRCGFVVSTIYHVFETLPVAFKNNAWSQKTYFLGKSRVF